MFILLITSLVVNTLANEITALRLWLEKGGSELHRVEVVIDGPGQRRVIAKQDIQAGQPVLMVKNQFLVQKKFYINESPSVHEILNNAYQVENNQVFLAMYMIEQSHKKDTQWKPFIDSLPQDVLDFPLYYDEEYLNLLKGHSVYDKILNEKTKYRRQWDELKKVCPEITRQDMKLDEYIYWRMMALSRAFGLSHGVSLVPFGDLINSEPNGHVESREITDSKDFFFRALRDIKKGEEIYFTYTPDGNEHYLIHYGYASLRNFVNHFKLIHCLSDTDPFYKQKYALFNNSKCQSSYFHNKTNTYREALSISRIIKIDNKGELEQLQKQKSIYNQTKAVSITSEIKTITNLITHMQDTLKRLPSSIQDDKAIIENPNTHYVRRFIAIYTMMEKQVLQQNIGYLEQALSMMNKSSSEIKKLIKYQTHKEVKIYINEEILPLKMKDEL